MQVSKTLCVPSRTPRCLQAEYKSKNRALDSQKSGPCTTKQVQHAQDKFSLSCFTKPDNGNHVKQYHNGGYQLFNSTQVSPIERWACSRKKGRVCQIRSITNMDKARAPCFTKEEQTLILNKYEEFKCIIQVKATLLLLPKKRGMLGENGQL